MSNGVIVTDDFVESVISAMQTRQSLLDQFSIDMDNHYAAEKAKVDAITIRWWDFGLSRKINDYKFFIKYNESCLKNFGDFREEIKNLKSMQNNANIDQIVIPDDNFERYQRIVNGVKDGHLKLRKALDAHPRYTFEEFSK